MKSILTIVMLCLLPFGLLAQSFQEGVSISPFSVRDQFEKNLSIDANTKEIIIAFAQEQGNVMKTFLEANPNYLSQNNAVYLMDATKVPSMVLSMFMLPKFKKYPYTIGVVEDEKMVATFPFQEGKLTVITLENLTIKAISFKDKW
jgi:hypothetical protein